MRNVIFLAALAACGDPGDAGGSLLDDGSELRISEGTPEAVGVLGFLNDVGTTVEVLDADVGLDSRAAKAIIAHRDGLDGLFGTADDDLFQTIEEVDDRSFVGDKALGLILDHVHANGWIPGPTDVVGTWEGVTFTTAQMTAVLAVANHATERELDDGAGLDKRAAVGIVAARPVIDLDQLAAVPYIGASALEKLKTFAETYVVPPDDGEGGLGDRCDTDADCQSGLRCLGAIQYGAGIECVETWGVFSYTKSVAIPDNGTELVTSVDVQGLATVPVDVVLTIDIDHPRPSDLVLTIDNFNGYGTTLWSGGDKNPKLEMVVYAFPSDDAVHGVYNVRLTDKVAGKAGTLKGWDLLIISAFD